MSRRSIAAAVAALTTIGAVAVAPAAQAYDRDAYSYAAGHMIERSDVPKVLGAMKPSMAFNGYSGDGTVLLCQVPQSDPQVPDVEVKFPGSRYVWNGGYNGRGKDAPFINVSVYQYKGSEAAINAFDSLKKRITSCTGTGSTSYTGDGTTSTYSVEVSHGVVPSVTVTGVESVFVSNNSLSETTPGDSRFVNDQYSVYTLVDDVIINTSYFSNTNVNLTTKQRRAVDQVAFNAVGRWVG